jgi:predicted ATPase
MGLNGMGKSTFIQSLLLLKQSDQLKNGQIQLNGEYLNIGTTKDALYQYSKQENLSINVEFTNGSHKLFDCNYIIEADVFNIKDTEFDADFFSNSLFSSNFQYLNANRLEPRPIYNKSYSSVVNNYNVGIRGEYTTHFIEVHGNEEILFDSLLHKNSKIIDPSNGKELLNKTLINQINLWMGEISPGINIRTTSIPNSDFILLEYVYKQPNYGNTNRFKPANVGFGISYALPVVTALLASKPNELIIIENPESHIHPRGQAELGKLIALAALNDIQIIVETHSDHVLNGIRVATKENENLSNREVVFYFEKEITESEQFSKITNINIDKGGELSEYPTNLSDEWSNQLLKLL